MTEPITQRIIAPSDCVIVLAIPTTRERFDEALLLPANRDFVPNVCKTWLAYRRQVWTAFDRALPVWDQLKVRVIRDASFLEFRQLVRGSPSPPVVILFAHWVNTGITGEAIEFAEGLVTTVEVLDAVPYSYAGILDLCVCRPVTLANSISNLRPKCLVKYVPKNTTPALWFIFYVVLFKLLRERPRTYLQAFDLAREEFMGSFKS